MAGKGVGGSKGRGAAGRSDAAIALRRRIGRVLTIAAGFGVLWFAVEGGEYGTFDLVRQGRAEARLRAEIDSVQRIVDSLAAYHKRLQTDVELQERIAREEFGMVKGAHELLYRFAEPGVDSGGVRR